MKAKTFDPKDAIDPSRALVPAVVRVNSRVVRTGFWPKLRRVATRIPFAGDAVALWYAAWDKATPLPAKAVILAALAYFVTPVDFLPDWFAGLGFTDDAAVIAAALAIVGRIVKDDHRKAARDALDRFVGD